MDAIDAEVLATLQDDVLRPAVIERTIARIREAVSPARSEDRRAQLARDLAAVEQECERLADAIVQSGTLGVLVSRLQIGKPAWKRYEGHLLSSRCRRHSTAGRTSSGASGRSWTTGAGCSRETSKAGAKFCGSC